MAALHRSQPNGDALLQAIMRLNYELLTDDLCTKGYHIIDDFLPQSDYEALADKAIRLHEHGLYQQAKIGSQADAQQNKQIRTDNIYWIDDKSEEPCTQTYFNTVNGLAKHLNRSLFLSLSEFETHFATYPPGTFYRKHIDQFKTTNNRKISCVYYLNVHWNASLGGALRLYNPQDALIGETLPTGNRFICFNSELPHEVCLTHQTRYSITGWLKTRAG